MNKSIKKTLRFLMIFIGVIFILPTLLFIALRIHSVQNFIAKRITDHLSEKIHSTVSLGKIEYDFFNKLVLSEVLIKDQQNDTLIYSKEIDLGIRKISLKNKSFRFGRIVLDQPVFSLITDSTGRSNLAWYLDMLKSQDSTGKKSSIRLIIDQININDARFALVNKTGPKSKTPVNFSNLKLSGINGQVEDFVIRGDSTSFEVYRLGLHESSGFSINEMSSHVAIGKQGLKFNSLHVTTDTSIINVKKIEIHPDSLTAYRNFTEDVKLDFIFDRSLINSSDLKYFVPLKKEINESVWLSGRLFGTISELRGRNISFSYRDRTNLSCDFDVTGLTKIENAFIYIDVSKLETNAYDIEKLDLTDKEKLNLPEFLYDLGNISFEGNFTGFTTDFVTYGKIMTKQGNVRVDLSLRPEESRFRIKGLMTGSSINLGAISNNNKLLGLMSMEANIDGYASSLKNFAANLTCKVDSIEINRYTYRNIVLNGFFTEKMWDGNINVKEDNIKMELLGMFNFRGELPEFDFSLKLDEANLHKLNFDAKDSTSAISLALTSNFIGNNIDNLDGEIKLINTRIKKHGNNLDLKDFSVRTYKENNKPAISLRTDFADVDIKGYYSFSGLAGMVESTLHSILPSVYEAPEEKESKAPNNFTFNINLKNTDKINNFFKTGLLISENTYINGLVSSDSLITVAGRSALFSFKNNVFNDLSLDAQVSRTALSADISTSSLGFLGQTELKGFGINVGAKSDNFNFSTEWDNKTDILNKGKFSARGTFSRSVESGKPVLNIRIDSSDVYVRNKLWQINQSGVVIDSNAIKINNIYIANNGYFYQIDGAVSEDPRDTLRLNFRGIDISPLNYLGKKKKNQNTEVIPLNISGRLNGNILLTNIYKNPLLESNIRINGLSLLDNTFGDMAISSAWDKKEKVININASNTLNGARMMETGGYYDPSSKEINLDVKANKLPIGALNPLLKIFASGISGFASGKIKLSGALNKLNLTGSVFAQDASLKIDYLQSVYKLNDTIRFDPNGIRFNNVKLTDVNGNPATINGYVYHKNLKDYTANLTVSTNKTMVLNTRAKDNEMYYGTAFATGVTTIKTDPSLLSFDISARTEGNTKFFIPLTSGLTVSDYSFIKFIDPAHPDTLNLLASKPAVPKQTGMDLNIDLQVTPAAEVKLIFDAKVGDEMTGVGSGDLNITLDPKGNFKMSGDYNIEKGKYLFTLGSILNKLFDVENGGRITFNGNIDNTEIDIKAIYGPIKTSLYEIIPEDRYKERTDVNCILNLTGNLFNPTVKLDIDLPNADEETRTYLKSMINTDEELNRQFFSLLAMNSFMATTNSTATGTSALSVTTFEMLSNQLSNWLSQLSSDYALSVNYRPGNKNMNAQELEVALSTQLLDDKVQVNIRGTSSTENKTNQISGDFDAEVKITDKIRFKVFNRYNNPYTGKLADYTQGIGLFYRQEFDKFSNLFHKKNKPELKTDKPEMKKEEVPAINNK